MPLQFSISVFQLFQYPRPDRKETAFTSLDIFQTYLEAAKTKFTRGYKGLSPNKITTTVGQNVGGITYAGIKLSFWDLGGQEELQPLWEKVRDRKTCSTGQL